jgi:hypothetical protein
MMSEVSMALPWLRILDTVLAVTDLARGRSTRPTREETPPESAVVPDSRALGALGQFETRLAGVMVAALKEVFDRDTRRLELEREQLEHERQRADRALRLELVRQTGDREIGRLRLVGALAVGSWIGTLFFSTRLIGAGVGSRIALGVGWALLLAAFAAAFSAQARVSDALGRMAEGSARPDEISSGVAGVLAVWLVVFALGLVGLAILVA